MRWAETRAREVRVVVVPSPDWEGSDSEGRPAGPGGGQRNAQSQSERELDTRLALLTGLECRVRLDAAQHVSTDWGVLKIGGRARRGANVRLYVLIVARHRSTG